MDIDDVSNLWTSVLGIFFFIILLHFVLNKKGKDIYRKMYRKSLVFGQQGMRKFITGDHVLNFAAAAKTERLYQCELFFGGGDTWRKVEVSFNEDVQLELQYSNILSSTTRTMKRKEKILKKNRKTKKKSKTKTFVKMSKYLKLIPLLR